MINVGSSKILPYEKSLIAKVLNSGQISPSTYCRRFETEFARIHEVKHAAFVSSGTDALRIALLALKEKYGWKDGDEVLVPAITFVATVNVVLQAGLRPVLVDISLNDYMINPWRIMPSEPVSVGMKKGKIAYERLTNMQIDKTKCKAIIVAHLFGQPADMDPLMAAAKYHNLKVVEDSCETMFVRYKKKMVGSFGDVSCFSTYACHLLSTGVGGLVCTKDDSLNRIIRSFANHGRDPAYIPGYSKPKTIDDFVDKHFKYDRIGYSSRATELQAALGLGQLKVYKDLLKKRASNANYLINHLSRWSNHLKLPYVSLGREHAWMMFPILLHETSQKRKLMIHLMKSGIEARDMMPITNQPCYKKLDFSGESEAQKVNDRGFYIGCHPELTLKDLKKIVEAFRKFFT